VAGEEDAVMANDYERRARAIAVNVDEFARKECVAAILALVADAVNAAEGQFASKVAALIARLRAVEDSRDAAEARAASWEARYWRADAEIRELKGEKP
jgi:hypothetical protein